MRNVKAIYYVPDLGNSPARVDRSSGEIFINARLWKNLPFAHRLFILLHEFGHVALDTSDELAVDEFAHRLYMEMGYPLSESVKALTQVLKYDDNGQQLERTKHQLTRAQQFDYYVNCNYKTFDL